MKVTIEMAKCALERYNLMRGQGGYFMSSTPVQAMLCALQEVLKDIPEPPKALLCKHCGRGLMEGNMPYDPLSGPYYVHAMSMKAACELTAEPE